MASSNKTAHYQLSQYGATDKPTYMGDYNTDMDNIDTGIYNAQTKADTAFANAASADTKADNAQLTANQALNSAGSANTNIGTMANLTTTEKSSLVVAINEVNNTLNFTSFKQYTAQSQDYSLVNGSMTGMNMNLAKTYNGSYAKIYGQVYFNVSQNQTGHTVLTITNTGLTIPDEFTVVANGIIVDSVNNNVVSISRLDAKFKTSGNIELEPSWNLTTGDYQFILFPAVIQLKSFGDQPE